MDVSGPAPLERRPRKSALLAAILALLCPGLGQFYVGRPGRGAWFLFVVLATFAAGLRLTEGRGIVWDTSSVWFYAHVLATGPTALVSWLTRDLTIVSRIPTWDAELLYCAVAGLLNVVVLADALGVVDEVNADADARDAEERERAAAAMAAAAAAAQAAAAAEAAAAIEVGAGGLPAGEEGSPAGAPPAAASPAQPREETPEFAEGLPPPAAGEASARARPADALPEGPSPEGAA